MIQRLQKKALDHGATSFGYSKTKNKKYYVIYNGHRINFGKKDSDHFTIPRQLAYWGRHSKIKDKQGRRLINNKQSAIYWASRLLWTA